MIGLMFLHTRRKCPVSHEEIRWLDLHIGLAATTANVVLAVEKNKKNLTGAKWEMALILIITID